MNELTPLVIHFVMLVKRISVAWMWGKQRAVGLTLSDKIDDRIATIEQALQCLILRWDGQENPWQVPILPPIE